jgi:hypothetical protein
LLQKDLLVLYGAPPRHDLYVFFNLHINPQKKTQPMSNKNVVQGSFVSSHISLIFPFLSFPFGRSSGQYKDTAFESTCNTQIVI